MLKSALGCYYKLVKLHFSDLKLCLETKTRSSQSAPRQKTEGLMEIQQQEVRVPQYHNKRAAQLPNPAEPQQFIQKIVVL